MLRCDSFILSRNCEYIFPAQTFIILCAEDVLAQQSLYFCNKCSPCENFRQSKLLWYSDSSLGLAGRMNHRRIFIRGGAVTNVCLIPTPFYAFLPRFGILVPGIMDVNNTPMLWTLWSRTRQGNKSDVSVGWRVYYLSTGKLVTIHFNFSLSTTLNR